MPRKPKLTNVWDKTFPKDPAVNQKKVVFHNRFGISLVGDLYSPVDQVGPLPALAVSGPFGAVKEQVSGLYAQKMASLGFVTLAFDPSYTGESGGLPRHVASPDINTDDFSSAVDYLISLPEVDKERIGIIGICGWGGLALNAAALDPRIKATVTSTMYDLSRVNMKGYFDEQDNKEARDAVRKAMAEARNVDFKNGTFAKAGGLPEVAPDDAPQFVKDYVAYYKTEIGYHPRGVASNDGWNVTGCLSFLNTPLMHYIDEISGAVLLIHGEKAHSRYMSETAYSRLKGDNKELMIIPGAVHTDLYYKMDVIPFAKIDEFFKKNL